MPLYSIGSVQKMTGLTGRQIRYYESAGLISPERTEGNQRRFRPADVARLLRIKELIASNLDVKDVKRVLAREDSGELETSEAIGDDQWRAVSQKLTSLYPVSDRAELAALLDRLSRKEK